MNQEDTCWYEGYQHLSYEMLIRRYGKGYLQEEEGSPITDSTLLAGAQADVDHFLDEQLEEAREEAYGQGSDDRGSELEDELQQMENRIRELLDEVDSLQPEKFIALENENKRLKKEAQRHRAARESVYGELGYELGLLLDTSAIDPNDVEAWAYQDGRNEVIEMLMKKLSEMKESMNEDQA